MADDAKGNALDDDSDYESSEYESSDMGSDGHGGGDGPGGDDAPSARTAPPGVPSLGLGGLGGGGGTSRVAIPSLGLGKLPPAEAPPESARGRSGVPGLNLSMPAAAAAPALADNSNGGMTHRGARPTMEKRSLSLELPFRPDRAVEEAADGRVVAVDLISDAFPVVRCKDKARLPGAQGDGAVSMLDAVRQRCMAGLGVAESELSFFEIREIKGGDVPDDASRIGVKINKSGFSLGQLESMVDENRRMTSTVDKCMSTMSQVQESFAEQSKKLEALQAEAARAAGEAQRWKELAEARESELGVLQSQLARADGMRAEGQQALDSLKQEFEHLTADAVSGGTGHDGGKPGRHLPPLGGGGAGAEGAEAVAARLVAEARAAKVVGSLCDERVLGRLEALLERL